MRIKRISHFSTCLAFVLLAGCGGVADRPAVAPTSGTVMYKGQPVEGASVSFWAEGAPRAATGVSDAEGKFKLSMFSAFDGAIAGENKITVSKMEAAAAPPSSTTTQQTLNDPTALTTAYVDRMNATKKGGPKSLVPAKYGKVETTPLKETVAPDGDNTFVLQLTD